MATLDDLKKKLAEAMKLYERLRARSALAARAGLGTSYQNTVGRFQGIADKVVAATKATSFTDAVSALWGGQKVNGLGIVVAVPWIAGTAIAGLSTLIAGWLTEAYELDRRLDAKEAAERAGASSAQAARDVATAAGDGAGTGKVGGMLGNMNKLLWGGALLATVVIAGPPIVDAITSNKGSK